MKTKTKRIAKSFGQSSKSIKFCATYGGFAVYSGFPYAERQTRKIRTEQKRFRFCNRHNLHIRSTKYAFKGGHRHDSNNPGNFQVMLEYRERSGDTVLAEHLKRTKENNGGRNCTYRSKTIQNEVIKCFEQELRGIIISEVKRAKFSSVMADECSDVANKDSWQLLSAMLMKTMRFVKILLSLLNAKPE